MMVHLPSSKKERFSAEETDLLVGKVKAHDPVAPDHQFKILFIHLLQMYFHWFFEKV